jgi:ACS family sodium-dependent inorganic phosphate cotransporter
MMITLAVAWFLSYADRVNMSVASIPMQAEFGWNETTKGLVMGSVFLGYLSSQLLGGWIVNRIGAARMVGLAVLGFSLLTLVTPAAASFSFTALIITRVALGIAEGFAVPATYAFMGRWMPQNERARLLAIVVSGATIGAPGGLIASGFLVEAFGWQSAFYTFGLLGLAWCVYWLRVARDDPASHPQISDQERTLLADNGGDDGDDTSIPVRSAVQGISLAGSGLFAALPWIAMSLMLYVASGYSDGLLARGRDLDFVRKLMQVIGLGGAMVFLALIPFAASPAMALFATCGAMAALAACYSGADPTVLELAPRYRGFLTGVVGTIGNIPGVIAIPMIGWLVDTTGSYSWGFITAAMLNVFGIVVWLIFGTGRKVID